MDVYFDNAASTRVRKEVIELMVKTMEADYANPGARHKKGVEAEEYIRQAASRIGKCIGAQPKEILFTSGGTESNNLALTGAARANARQGRHIITSAIEHAAVYRPLEALQEEGFELTVLPVDKRGQVSQRALKEALREDTILVSIMYVNNEMGAIEPVDCFGPLIKAANPHTLFHVDAVQAFGKLPIRVKDWRIDLLSVSGHKLQGPKGVGFLYAASGVKLAPLLFGGGQQRGLRSGTLNAPGIAGLGLAGELAYSDLAKTTEEIRNISECIIKGLSDVEGVYSNSCLEEGVPHILSLRVEGIPSEVLLHALEEKGIYVSSGAACSSSHPGISGTLRAIGLREEEAASTIRLSFSRDTTLEEGEYFLKQFRALLPLLRRFVRR